MQGIRKPLRIAILGSTNGTDMDAIIAGIKLGEVPASIVLVASDRSDAPILARAAGHGIPIAAATEKGLARDGQLSSLCEQHDVELIILIGDMRILSETFCSRWEHRILNVHPSLLPEFAGTMDQDTHTLAIKRMRETGNRITGCTVHLVTPEVDAGRIMLQRRCTINDVVTRALEAQGPNVEGEALCTCIKAAYPRRGDLSNVVEEVKNAGSSEPAGVWQRGSYAPRAGDAKKSGKKYCCHHLADTSPMGTLKHMMHMLSRI
jgi:folate-dependent phosphoribosylglycinamide formyltransferase PurN